jgi:hypothetical protein
VKLTAAPGALRRDPSGLSRFFAIGLVLGLQVVLWPHAAYAQSGNAYRGLFGQRQSEKKRPQAMDFTMSVVDGYDTANDQFGIPSSGSPVAGGGFANLDAAFRYTRGRNQRLFTVTASDALRYQPVIQPLPSSTYDGAVSFVTPVGYRKRLTLSQSAAYTPYYQLQLFPELPTETTPLPEAQSNDYAISKTSASTFTSAVSYAQDIGRRSLLQVGYELRSVMFSDAARDLRTDDTSVTFVRRATRFTSFRLMGGTRVGTYGQDARSEGTRTEEAQFGFDYARRRAAVSLSGGATFFPVGDGTSARMTGSVSLLLPLSRKWSSSFQYKRALQFVEAASYPFLADSFSAGLNGQVSRRLSLSSSFGYSAGQVGVSAEGGTYGTYAGSGQVAYSLTRHYALYTEYVYYQYAFDRNTIIGTIPSQFERQTVRVGLKLWFPLVN